MLKLVNKLRAASLQLLPNECCLCKGKTHSQANLCGHCYNLLPTASQLCPRCATPLNNQQSCAACTTQEPPFDHVYVACSWNWALQTLLHHYKFQGALTTGLALQHVFSSRLSTPLVSTAEHIDGIIALPLHPNRLASRGFNQSWQLAQALSQSTHLPLYKQGLDRIKDTPSQAGLTRAQRQTNLKGAFAGTQTVAGKNLLLVDDIMTTGSSAYMATEALLSAGANRVSVAVLGKVL